MIHSKATLRGEPVTWDSDEGRTLMELLPPSTNVTNFRIAHELAHLQSHDWLWGLALSPLVLVAGYHLVVFLCKCTVEPPIMGTLMYPTSKRAL